MEILKNTNDLGQFSVLLRLCSANHRPGYWSNLPCDWPSTACAYSKKGTETKPWQCRKSEHHQPQYWLRLPRIIQTCELQVIGIDHDTVCAGVVCAATPGTARVGRPARGRAGRPTSAVPGVAAQTTTAQTVWVVNFYSTTKTKQNTTINPATVMTMSAMLNRPGWQRHCDDESVHRYSVRIIDQRDVTIA